MIRPRALLTLLFALVALAVVLCMLGVSRAHAQVTRDRRGNVYSLSRPPPGADLQAGPRPGRYCTHGWRGRSFVIEDCDLTGWTTARQLGLHRDMTAGPPGAQYYIRWNTLDPGSLCVVLWAQGLPCRPEGGASRDPMIVTLPAFSTPMVDYDPWTRYPSSRVPY